MPGAPAADDTRPAAPRPAHPHLAPAEAPPAPPASSWDELRGWCAGLLDALATLHAHDSTQGACDAAHVRATAGSVGWAPSGVVGTRAGDLQGFGVWLWTQVTGDRPGLGRTPRFAVPEQLVDVAGQLLHPEPLGRFASAADVAAAVAGLGPAEPPSAWFLPDATVGSPPRPPAPAMPIEPPAGVSPVSWSALAEVRAEGRSRAVVLRGDDVLPAILAFVRAVERSGVGAIRWVGLGDHAVEEQPELGDDAALRLARATGGTLEEAAAELAAIRAWRRTGRGAADPALRTFLREVRGEGWRGASILVLTGVASAAPGQVAQLVDAVDPPDERRGDAVGLPVLWVSDGPLGRDAVEDVAPATAWPDDAGGARRLVDLRHLVGLAGPVLPRRVIERWAGPELSRFLEDPGVGCWGGRVWVSSLRASAWRAEAEARPDAKYLHRRVARALRELAPARAARHAAAAGDEDLAEGLALDVPGPRCWGPGPTGPRTTLPSPAALEAAALLSRVPSRTTVLARRALRAEHLAFGRAWAGEPARAAEWLAESRATESAGDAGLRRAGQLSALRLLAGDDAGADEAFEDALALADGEEVHALWVQRAAWLAWVRRSAAARAALGRARDVERVRAAAEGEAALVESAIERGEASFAAARAAAAAASARFAEARDVLGALRADLAAAEIDRASRSALDPDRVGELWRRAAAAGARDLVAEVDCLDGDRARDAGQLEEARRHYARAFGWASEVGHLDLRARGGLGAARMLHAAGDVAEATEWTRRSVEGLSACARHPVWAPYRLLVAVLLAERSDHTQTWQWLWSAQEAGVAELADPDAVADLERLASLAEARSWGNVLRLAGKLGSELHARLGDREAAESLTRRVAEVVLGR